MNNYLSDCGNIMVAIPGVISRQRDEKPVFVAF